MTGEGKKKKEALGRMLPRLPHNYWKPYQIFIGNLSEIILDICMIFWQTDNELGI